jgi:hypothetical protein
MKVDIRDYLFVSFGGMAPYFIYVLEALFSHQVDTSRKKKTTWRIEYEYISNISQFDKIQSLPSP